MTKEKSCGAVVWKKNGDTRLYLLEYMKLGHISIPKGHVENNETEEETALREIREETNLEVMLDTGFRKTISYSPKEGVIKDVVFFTAEAVTDMLINQECEVSSLRWCPLEEALDLLTFESDRDTLSEADCYLSKP